MSSAEKTYLRQILEDERQQVYPTLKPDEHFELFSAVQILKKYELDNNEIMSGLIDGGNDGQVDGIYLFANRQLIREDTHAPSRQEQANIDLIIISARSGAGSFNTEVIEKLQKTTNHLLNPSHDVRKIQSLYNQGLLDATQRFRKLYLALRKHHPNLKIVFNYVTVGDEVSPHVEEARDALVARVRELYNPVTCEVALIGAKGLLTLFDKNPPTTIELATTKLLPLGKDAYIAIVKLSDFFNFISDSEQELLRRIFESNVRDYQGNVKVNQNIQATLQSGERDEEFWWLNNGISILASEVRGHGETLLIDDPQIVNGLQTSREIHAYFRTHHQFTDPRHILVRVIKTQKPETRDRIIKATNNQTQIPSPWLHATEEVHRHIEVYFKSHDLFYDRRKNFYKNQGMPADKIITIPWLGQSIMSIALSRPNDARARPTTFLNNAYRQVFSKSYQPELYLNCAQLMRSVEAFLQSKNLARTTQNNIEFHLAMYTGCLMLSHPGPLREKAKDLNVKELTVATLEDAHRHVYREYRRLGATDQTAKGPRFVEKLVRDLRDRFQLNHRT
jgi:AIPR protein